MPDELTSVLADIQAHGPDSERLHRLFRALARAKLFVRVEGAREEQDSKVLEIRSVTGPGGQPQVPVFTTAKLAREWTGEGGHFAQLDMQILCGNAAGLGAVLTINPGQPAGG